MADTRIPQNWHDVTAVILAGGLGTRLRSVVPDRPKCLANVNGRPFLHHQFDRLAASGIRRAVLCTGHLADQVEAAMGRNYGEIEIRYSREETPLGTGGALRLAAEQVTTSVMLAMNGDSLCEVEWGCLQKTAEAAAGEPIMLLSHVPDTERFGRIECRETPQGVRVFDFKEKGDRGPGWINAGMYFISTSDIRQLPLHAVVSLEQEVFPGWAREGRLWGHLLSGDFLDIGTPETYARAGEFTGVARRPQEAPMQNAGPLR